METNECIGRTAGRRMTHHMMVVEYELYTSKSGFRTSEELLNAIKENKQYGTYHVPTSHRTLQSIIRKLREEYLAAYDIPEDESIRVSRSGAVAKYWLGDRTRSHLLFPENVFNSKTDKSKMNLLLKVGEYFSLPLEAFLRKEDIPNRDIEEIFNGRIEIKKRPYDSKVFADIFSAIENSQVIEFNYEPQTVTKNSTANDTPIVSPYYLKSYNNKWYLIGHVSKSPNRWTVFALDRISNVKPNADRQFYELDVRIIENFYENVIGFFVPPNPDGSFPKSEKELDIKEITITLKNEKAAFFLMKNPLHKSQIRCKGNPLQFRIRCLENLHLYQSLLKILDSIQWIEPEIIRNRLTSKLEDGLNLLKPQNFCGLNN